MNFLHYIKPYVINYSSREIWHEKCSNIKKTRAFRKCSESIKKRIRSMGGNGTLRDIYLQINTAKELYDCISHLDTKLIPENIQGKFVSELILLLESYLNDCLDAKGMEQQKLLWDSHLDILEDRDYSERGKVSRILSELNANGECTQNESLFMPALRRTLLLASMNHDEIFNCPFRILAKEHINELLYNFVNLEFSTSVNDQLSMRHLMDLILDQTFLSLMNIDYYVAYVESIKNNHVIDLRPATEILRNRHAYFVKRMICLTINDPMNYMATL